MSLVRASGQNFEARRVTSWRAVMQLSRTLETQQKELGRSWTHDHCIDTLNLLSSYISSVIQGVIIDGNKQHLVDHPEILAGETSILIKANILAKSSK